MFGAHHNLHTGPAKYNHIELSKQPDWQTQIHAKEFDWQVASRLVDKLVVDLADFTMSSTAATATTMPQLSNAIPHNLAIFDMQFWTDATGHVHADIATPTIHGKYLPSTIVLHCLAAYCMGHDIIEIVDVITQIVCYRTKNQ